MDDKTLTGGLLIGIGLLEIPIALFLVGPRLPQAHRRIVVGGMLGGAVLVCAVGAVFLAGVI